MNTHYIVLFGVLLLFIIGLFGALTKRNLIKIMIALGIVDTGVNLFFITIGYISGKTAPIFSKQGLTPGQMVDPVPQALVLTAIVIGVAVLALGLSIVIRVYEHYGTLNVSKIKKMRG
ncbi:multicomponent Na+:H+ antiporter subunit C [Thermotomaculum hydrothermale]|uniref:NADH-quinone oxidoreductase subunit K n=2 Tax=Thermotomaculum hydrothermale TaxID=981385 RepID=A0A7R6PIS9_9BACT|nr:multicomponent Na+:H+ antiporter subunit C [Thermotomaculum hydrothermale]